MNCNGCIANTMCQTAIGSSDAYFIVLKARERCDDLQKRRLCQLQQSAAQVLDTGQRVIDAPGWAVTRQDAQTVEVQCLIP
jgi:hypothetical protein